MNEDRIKVALHNEFKRALGSLTIEQFRQAYEYFEEKCRIKKL